MMTSKLIYCLDNRVDIYEDGLGSLEMRKGAYIGDLRLKSSLLQILPLFELPVENILSGIQDKTMRISAILPFDEILTFLITEMKSSYWYGLVCLFLLDDQVHVRLSENVMKYLQDKRLIVWLPQREKHLSYRVYRKGLQEFY